MNTFLKRKFKDEAVSVYSIENGISGLKEYVVSTRDTRDLMNYPEIVNIDFTEKMRNGITSSLKALNHLEQLSSINSRTVNVFHILRGGLNFQMASALNKAYGYRWHSCSYISSQRFLKEGKFEISEDMYRKFVLPDNSTIYTADIVASGVSLDNSLKYLDAFMESNNYELKNFVFFTIGCSEASKVLRKWQQHFKEKYTGFERMIVCYLEGQFALANADTPLANVLPDTDLLKSYKFGALLAPEFEYSQFEKFKIALEACAIYDGGKKGFEPINHIKDILEFWEKQEKTAEESNLSVWEEYNARFPLDHYYADIDNLVLATPAQFKENKIALWQGLRDSEYTQLFTRFKWLWDDKRIEWSKEPGTFAQMCRKKIKYLNSLLATV